MGIGSSVISRETHILVYTAPPIPLPVAVVQSAWSTGLTAAVTAAVPLEPTREGNCLVVVVVTANATTNATIQAVTADGQAGNFGALYSEGTGTSPAIVSVWACPGCARGLTEVEITTTGGAGDSLMSVLVLEVQGLAATLAGLLDQTAGATGTGTAWSSGATAATTQASELWVGAAGGYAAGTSCLFTGPGSPWTGLNVAANPLAAGYQVVSATGAAEWAGTAAAAEGWTAAVVALKPAAPGVLLGAMSDAVLTDQTGAKVPQGSLITAGQIFEYAGTPAAGNPPITWAVPAGVTLDPYGNSLPVSGGMATYDPSSGLIAQLLAGQLVLTTAPSPPGAVTLSMATASADGISGAVGTIAASAGGTLSTNLEVASAAAGTPGINLYGYEGGFGFTGGLVGAIAGTWNYLLTPGNATPTVETWHAPSYDTGWAAGPDSGTVQPLAYRIAADGTLQLIGACHATAAHSAGNGVITLPTGWLPATTQRCPAVVNTGGTITATYLEIDGNGTVSIGTAITSGADVYVSAIVRLN